MSVVADTFFTLSLLRVGRTARRYGNVFQSLQYPSKRHPFEHGAAVIIVGERRYRETASGKGEPAQAAVSKAALFSGIRFMLKVNDRIQLPEEELAVTFIRSSGPGGQNVNNVATAVQLRFNITHSNVLPKRVKQRLYSLYSNRISATGDLIIEAREHRTQQQNRRTARQRLADMIREAARQPRKRVPTKPTKASEKRRIEEKKQRGWKKERRKRIE